MMDGGFEWHGDGEITLDASSSQPPTAPSSDASNTTAADTNAAAAAAAWLDEHVDFIDDDEGRVPSPYAHRRALLGHHSVTERLTLTQHGLVGEAYARKGVCTTGIDAELNMAVGLQAVSDTTGLFCTDATSQGDFYIGVNALALANNVTMPPRHWYTLTIAHEIFDASDLMSAEGRFGCLNYGQMRMYRIETHGASDATLDAIVSEPVSAIYAKRGSAPTAVDYDALAAWPLQRVSLSGCDVLTPTVWYIAVVLEPEGAALTRDPPLQRTRFTLTAHLREANVSLMALPFGTRVPLMHNSLCCGVSHDYVVEGITRELALRVEVTIHPNADGSMGYLEAIYLKHGSCGRYPSDIGPDESCIGRCEMQWLTTYNQYTLVPTYATTATVFVPMGVVDEDLRAPGDWYISVASASVVANYSLVAELVESPIIDTFIPLDAERAAAEKCGRFCVIMPDEEDDGLDDGLLESAAGASARNGVTIGVLLAVGVAWIVALVLGARGRRE